MDEIWEKLANDLRKRFHHKTFSTQCGDDPQEPKIIEDILLTRVEGANLCQYVQSFSISKVADRNRYEPMLL